MKIFSFDRFGNFQKDSVEKKLLEERNKLKTLEPVEHSEQSIRLEKND